MAILPTDLQGPSQRIRVRPIWTTCEFTTSGTLVHHNTLSIYNHYVYFLVVSNRDHIVTGFNPYPDATCRVRRQHRPISSNRTQSIRAEQQA